MLKRIVAVLLVSALLAGLPAMGAFAALYNYGDVNFDGKVNSSDALSVLRCASGVISFDRYARVLADVNADNKVNSSDALYILQYATGNIKKFPADKNYNASSLPLVNDSAFLNDAKSAINAQRRKAGVGEMNIDYTMCRLAGVRAGEVTKNKSHTRPNGSKYYTVYADFGVTKPKATGENIAWATKFYDAKDVINYWMESTIGHREVMLNGKYTRFGIAMIRSGDKDYAVLMLAN